MDIIELSSKKEYHITLARLSGEEYMKCPACSEDRKKKNIKCFSWNHEKEVGFCNHCECSFGVKKEFKKEVEYSRPVSNGTPLNDKALNWFTKRGISTETVNRFNITEYQNGCTWIKFNYYEGSELINAKSRNNKKEFRLEKNCKLIFYNINSIKNAKKCFIVEGEMDCLTLAECGIKEVISVPNGAHTKNNNLQYLDNCIDYFEGIESVYLLTDGDAPGISLRNELARRIGKDKCYFYEYPDGCKDPNDILLKYGKDQLLEFVSKRAKEFPLEGVLSSLDLSDGIDEIYNNGYPKTVKIGNELDDHITWRTGEWTVITGNPGSGKSEVLDQIALLLNIKHGWKFGVFSPENRPYQLHFWKLAQKLFGKMSKAFLPTEKERAKAYFKDNFFWIDIPDVTLEGLLSKARELVKRKGIKGFIFDPWNQIEHLIPAGQTETQYISECLSHIGNFVVANDVHIFLVAHPTKSRTNPDRLSLYDIAGSAHFFNKTYNGFTVKRNYDTDETIISIEKVKFWFVGKAGKEVSWYWDKNKGTRFFDFDSSKICEMPNTQAYAFPNVRNGEFYKGYNHEAGF